MISCSDFYRLLLRRRVEFFAGVPDSLLKDFCAYLQDHTPGKNHVIAANEGNAVALALGHYLATGKAGLVYMQNSGLGNAINPLLSLADARVYGIPMLLLIGWRGRPGVADEPQHAKQGAVMLPMLKAMGLPYAVLPGVWSKARPVVNRALLGLRKNSGPFALIVPEGTFRPYARRRAAGDSYNVSREEAIAAVVGQLGVKDCVVSTTGKASRELFEHRERLGQGHGGDFLTVGGMGHASQIALGIALSQPRRRVICLDGDGALIMHMGAMALVGSRRPRNFRHIVLNNGAHESVGGQPTAGFGMDIGAIAKACGYRRALRVASKAQLPRAVRRLLKERGPVLLEIRLNQRVRSDLGRPTSTPADNKRAFMQMLGRRA